MTDSATIDETDDHVFPSSRGCDEVLEVDEHPWSRIGGHADPQHSSPQDRPTQPTIPNTATVDRSDLEPQVYSIRVSGASIASDRATEVSGVAASVDREPVLTVESRELDHRWKPRAASRKAC